MDLTMKLASRGEKIEFCTKAIAYTEAPQTFSGLYKQRYRWSYGTWQVLYKYRNSIFQNGLNIFSGILYPYLFTFAVIDVITTFLFVGLFIFAVMNGLVHFYLFYLSMFIVLKFLLSLYSTVNLNDSKDSTLFTIQEYVFYTHIVSLISLKSLVDLTLGKPTLWNGVPRLGKNQLSASV